jgi:hypothetical protein
VRAESAGKREGGDATPFGDLNQLLVERVVGARDVLGESFCGAYLQGSFAVGDADAHSDVDFVVVTEDDVTPEQQAELQELNQTLYALPISWAQHLEGSYIPRKVLRRPDPDRRPLLYLDNGATEFAFDAHDNTARRGFISDHRPEQEGRADRGGHDRHHATMLAREASAEPVRPWPGVQPPAVRARTPISNPAPNNRATSPPSADQQRVPAAQAASLGRAVNEIRHTAPRTPKRLLASARKPTITGPRIGPAIHQASVESSVLCTVLRSFSS